MPTIFKVALHGGLGNQLFQYFFASIKAGQQAPADIHLITDFLGLYSSPRSVELHPLIEPRLSAGVRLSTAGLLPRARLPKVLKRITGREMALPIPGYGTIVDGYFQELAHYRTCPPPVMAEVLAQWRSPLRERLSLDIPGSGQLTHIRLGDFFNNPVTAREFAMRQLSAISGPTDLVTDQEDVLADELAKLNLSDHVRLLPSADMSAWDLIALMCRYESISTNGSTLAFWAAVLRGAQLHTTNNEHVAIWRLLGQATEKSNHGCK
jgi:hypothetical protein